MEGIDVPYHFDNFVHFSNAVDRIKNFEYKLKLIELYDAQILNLNDITGDTANLDVIKNFIAQYEGEADTEDAEYVAKCWHIVKNNLR